MNIIGNNIKVTVFGQSHAEAIGVTIDGLPSGIKIDTQYIQNVLDLRAPGKNDTATKRKEPDKVDFISGVVDGKTCGSSVCAVIYNKDQHSKDYSSLIGKPRPSHADMPAMIKYGDGYDIRGGGQFSGRLTAPICIAGAIALKLLEEKGIKIASHISSVGKIHDTPFNPLLDESELMDKLSSQAFAVIDEEKANEMHALILSASNNLDSIGGTIECKITGLPIGLGEPMFNGIENAISRIVFGIPAIKGIEFGAGFDGTTLYGSQYNDTYYYDELGRIRTRTNNTGGICGGMATGMPVIFRVAVKPTPSIARTQDTVNLVTKMNDTIVIKGRHDPCIVPRANIAVRAATALAVLDLIMSEKTL